jgi:hypothetical protein
MATRRTFSLEARSHVYRISVEVGPVWDYVADVDADAEADPPPAAGEDGADANRPPNSLPRWVARGYAANAKSRIFSSTCWNPGSGAEHMVRYVSRKASQPRFLGERSKPRNSAVPANARIHAFTVLRSARAAGLPGTPPDVDDTQS